MSPQVSELLLTDPEAANALSQAGFLGHFRAPASPSDVGRALGMPANLVHHHVQKFVRLGLLFEAGRERGRVLYQLSALTFKVPTDISLAARQLDTLFDRSVRHSTDALLEACHRSSRLNDHPGPWALCHFGDSERPQPALPQPVSTAEARPAYYVRRTLRLTPERYRQLLARLDHLIQAEESQGDAPGTALCTLSAFAFEGGAGEDDGAMMRSAFLNLTDGAGQ